MFVWRAGAIVAAAGSGTVCRERGFVSPHEAADLKHIFEAV